MKICDPIKTASFAHYKHAGLEQIVKWPGGKGKELKYIVPNLPVNFENYYEPFVGGGSVFAAIKARNLFINDKSQELINIYKIIQSTERTDFFKALHEIQYNWTVLGKVAKKNKLFFIRLYKSYSINKIDIAQVTNELFEFILKHSDEFNGMFSSIFNFNIENFIKEIKKNLIRKIKRMKKIEIKKHKLPDSDIIDNIETALKSAFYMYFRYLYNANGKHDLNKAFSTAIFLFIRNFAYSGMFRYNSKGEFNVPYGGIGYNKKNFGKKIQYLESDRLQQHLENTIIENKDFEEFLDKNHVTNKDFIFLDPPYDTEFSTYAQNKFNQNDQKRLANYLTKKTKAKWMMIIKNTEFILDLYTGKNLNIKMFNKTYLVSFMNRNNKNSKHLLIMNY